jgi:hypothetical protein
MELGQEETNVPSSFDSKLQQRFFCHEISLRTQAPLHAAVDVDDASIDPSYPASLGQ